MKLQEISGGGHSVNWVKLGPQCLGAKSCAKILPPAKCQMQVVTFRCTYTYTCVPGAVREMCPRGVYAISGLITNQSLPVRLQN